MISDLLVSVERGCAHGRSTAGPVARVQPGDDRLLLVHHAHLFLHHQELSGESGVLSGESLHGDAGSMPRTYLLTGGAGFIGSYLCRDLLTQGHQVRIIDNLSEQVHGTTDVYLPNDVELVHADVRDGQAVATALKGVDGVFHLAAEVGVGQSMYEIARYVGVNDLGTAVLLEQLSRNPVERLVVASSMSVYGEGRYRTPDGTPVPAVRRGTSRDASGWDPVLPDGTRLTPVPTDEAKEPDLASIYALTKYSQERSCMIIASAYGFDAVALRLFNVFGPGQALSNPYTGVLANFGARLLNGQRPIVFEDGQQRRDFVHVRDVAKAFRQAMESPAAAGQVFNIGSGHVYTIEQVAQMLAQSMGLADLSPEIIEKARTGDVRHCFADISKAQQQLGYAPTRRLQDSLDEMAEWIASSTARDRGEHAKRELEAHGLVG
ncbi:MAG TPA: NAD-dependent epimerase/dehydratase family protein [Rhodopila sp.]